MSTRTEGDWVAVTGEEYDRIFGECGTNSHFVIVSFEDECDEPWAIAETVGGLEGDQEEKNAYLLAAAPKLYEALRDMVAIARHENWQYQTDTGRNILLEHAQAALGAAKVTE